MQELTDNALLREYAAYRSEEAFAALVGRHLNRVYSIALRHTGNPHQAQEFTQSVFVLLTEKCSHLGEHVILEGWLYQTARFTALNSVRGEIRRNRREQEAQAQNIGNESDSDVWTQTWIDRHGRRVLLNRQERQTQHQNWSAPDQIQRKQPETPVTPTRIRLNDEPNAGKSAHRTLGTHEQQSIWEISDKALTPPVRSWRL